MLTIIDLNLSNLQSVRHAFERLGMQASVTNKAEDLERAAAIVLPGVGAFADGMASLRTAGLVEPLRRHALERGTPFLGICLGMQLLADEGEEYGRTPGLGLIRGVVRRLRPAASGCRVPNMGWCGVRVVKRASVLFPDRADGAAFYFAHSFALACAHPQDVAATLDFDGPIPAAIERGNLFGVQFHPEKSQDAGLDVLAAFVAAARISPALSA